MPDIFKERALSYHRHAPAGKLTVRPSKPCRTPEDLSLAYTPGVACPCLEIARDPELAYDFTTKGNTVAIVTNGTAVLGLGNIGPQAAKPVMEGKAVLFKHFADIDAIDLELDVLETLDVVRVVSAIAPGFGGINLEDIRSPECFEVEKLLREALSIPVFHDDQHGTAIVIAAALYNALDLNGKSLKEVRVVVNGAGAAAYATVKHLRLMGMDRGQICVCDRRGVIHLGREESPLDIHKSDLQVESKARTLAEALKGVDVFIGLSGPNLLGADELRSMAESPVIFALANPTPEISYVEAKKVRNDAIVATGRSDSPNQVNNVLAFPYVFRAALDARSPCINEEMRLAASMALSELAWSDPETGHPYDAEHLIPSPFDERLFIDISASVFQAAVASQVASRPLRDQEYRNLLENRWEEMMCRRA
jgi:malate dehydrogenase (oxaloacetate-decarboxylating)(NADP+)